MKINKLKLLLAVSIIVIFPAHNIPAKNPSQPVHPNIILILTDDLGYGDIGIVYQNQRAKAKDRGEPWALTPNLDKLATKGVQLSQHYCAAPVCAPSRASLLLGVSQGHANVRNNQFDKALEDNHTLASVMRTAGYSTAAFGKWGLQGISGATPNWTGHPLNRGFDYFLGYIRHEDGHEHYPKEGLYRGTKEVWENCTNIAPELDKCYTTDLWTAAAKKWIVNQVKSKDGRKPFFIYLAYDTPHAVLELPTQDYPAGGGSKGGLQWLGQPGHMINTASGEIDSWVHPEYANATYDNDSNPATPEVPWPDVYKRYATSTRRIDSAVGDIMQLLKDLKIDENTMIVFTSDNGPSKESYLPESYNPSFFHSFGPFDGIKRDCWEGGIHIPALVSWPGHIPAGRVVKTPSISYDWMATFANIAGIPAPARSDGISLLPSLTGVGKQQSSHVYVEYFHNGITPEYPDFAVQHQGRHRGQMQMIRLGDYVGIRYDIQSHNDNFEIYNIVKDPRQVHNLDKEPGMASLQQQMKDKVLQSRRTNNSASRPYDTELTPAVPQVKTVPGVEWKAYIGVFPWIPEVATLTPADTGYIDCPGTGIHEKNENEILYFEGFLQIPADGEYTFYLTANTGALLRIHSATVIDADYGYIRRTERSGTIKLKSGTHPFRLYHACHENSKPLLSLLWSGPGIGKQKIPTNIFCRHKPEK